MRDSICMFALWGKNNCSRQCLHRWQFFLSELSATTYGFAPTPIQRAFAKPWILPRAKQVSTGHLLTPVCALVPPFRIPSHPLPKRKPAASAAGIFLAVLNLIYIFRYAESQKALSRNGFFSSYRSACV